ncbi:RNase adapter RapZ [Candidatus Dependentiae bacterium]|nr:RNase adapter RapZ [Candidatus Dependentiae bacterium]
MSGAGKSFAVKCLEDGGYFCVDNIPTELLPKFGEILKVSTGEIKNAACVVDVRDKNFTKNIVKTLLQLDNLAINYEILFLDSDNDTLMRRFNETRRPHPLSKKNVLDGIKKERKLLQEIKGLATLVLNTSEFSGKNLKELLWNKFVSGSNSKKMTVNIVSFGFKNGIPHNVDLLIDVRFLPNPYYVDELAELNGDDQKVRDYIFNWNITKEFLNKFFDFISFLLPNYLKEGKTYLTIAIGCTGRQHRSVMTASLLNEFIQNINKPDIVTILDHRDKH